MRFVIRTVAAVLGIGLVAAGSAAAQPLLKLVRGPSLELAVQPPDVVATVPITWLGDALAAGVTVPADVRDVREGGRVVSSLAAALAADIVVASGGPTLRLRAPLATPIRPATYDVLIVVRRGTQTQSVDLKLTQPAAQLRALGTVIVEQQWEWFWGNPTVHLAPLPLRETSRRALVTDLTVTQSDPSVIGDRRISGRLTFGGAAQVLPGATSSASYQLGGDFPLGTAKGTLEVDAAQLASPVQVSFEVRSRLHPWLVLPIAGLGLLFGYLLRVALKAQVELGEARLQALDVEARLRSEHRQRQDRRFGAALDQPLLILEEARRGRDRARIATAISTANDALTTALKDLAQRRAEAETALQDLTRVVRTRWSVPPTIHDTLGRATAELDQIRERLNHDDAEAARALLTAATARLAQEVADAALVWSGDVLRALDRLEPARVFWPAELAAALQSTVEGARAALRALTGQLGAASPDHKALLEAVHAARVKLHLELVDQALARLELALDDVLVILRSRAVDRPEVQAVEKHVDALRQVLAETRARPEQLPRLVDSLGGVHDALVAAIRSGAPAEKLQETLSHLNAGRYLDAARLVGRPPAVSQEGQALGEGRGGGGAAATWTQAVWAIPAVSPLGPNTVTSLVQAIETPEPLEVERARTFRQVAGAKVLQTAGAGVLILGASWGVFADSFVGTITDVIRVFSWGFVADIGVDAFVEMAKSLRKT